MALEDFNGVRSTIIDQWETPVVNSMSRNGTFIFGTAKSGPINTPTKIGSKDMNLVFGDIPLDAGGFETSAVRLFYEFAQSFPNDPDIYIVRVGETRPARAEFYENPMVTGENDLAYTIDPDYDDDRPCKSFWLESIPEGSEYNKTKSVISAWDSTSGLEGKPKDLYVELPDGSSKRFSFSSIKKVSDLVNRINSEASFAGKIRAGFTPLEKEVTVKITAPELSGAVGDPVRYGPLDNIYDLNYVSGETYDGYQSWGNNLVSINSAYQKKDVSHLVATDSTVSTLPVVPQKSLTSTEPTISTFVRVVTRESVLRVIPTHAGRNNVTIKLGCTNIAGSLNQSYWTLSATPDADLTTQIPSEHTIGNVGHKWEAKLQVVKNGTSTLIDVPKAQYGISNNGYITIYKPVDSNFSLGDVYYLSYRYGVNYSEAKTRTDLQIGDDTSYFIMGDQIIFGADQPNDTYLYYNTKVYMSKGDIEITNYDMAEIKINNMGSMSRDSDLTLNISYEPEMPAPTGTYMPGGDIQPGSLKDGDDATSIPSSKGIMDKKSYTDSVVKALQSVDIYPRRHNLIAGLYLDDKTMGYNYETGLPEEAPLSMISKVMPYIERAANYTSECDITLPVRPPRDLTQKGINEWIDRLVNNSAIDPVRPANIIDGLKNFRIDVPVGAFTMQIAEVNNGREYMCNPASVFLASKSRLDMKETLTNAPLPGNISNLGVKIYNAEIIGKLNSKRYSTAVIDYNGRVIWADAPTLGVAGVSQFDRQFVRDTVYLAVELVREVCQKYIGKPRMPQYLMSMKKDAGKALGNLVPDILLDIFVDIVDVPGGHITGKTKLRLMLTTTREIRSVDIETRLTLA